MTMLQECLLAGDIGGTNTRLQLAIRQDEELQILAEHHYPSQSADSLEVILTKFLESYAPPSAVIRAACFALAGPVHQQAVKPTQLPWPVISAASLAQTFAIANVTLINDFAAIGHSLALLRPQDLVCLQAGEVAPGALRAVIGAGSGLGQCLVLPAATGFQVLETEGGHVDFAPADETELKLWAYLRQSYPHISYERVLSGAGIVRLYQFMSDVVNVPHDPVLRQAVVANDGPRQVSEAALAGSDAAAVAALDLFARIYGRQAGNWALSSLARGGVYIAGGIAPRILPVLQRSDFLTAFCGKGRFEPLMRKIPVHIITHPNPGLAGAMQVAARTA